jgi:hypothetical protein
MLVYSSRYYYSFFLTPNQRADFPAEPPRRSLDEFAPHEVVAELDKHIVGQYDAKRAVAVAISTPEGFWFFFPSILY